MMKYPDHFVGIWLLVLSGLLAACGSQTQQALNKAGQEGDGARVRGEVRASDHPRIWVRPGERAEILAKIAGNERVAAYYQAFTDRVEADLKAWEQSPAAYLSKLPFDDKAAKPGHIPPFKTYTDFSGEDRSEQDELMHQLQTAIDCGVLYFLTQEEQYARYASDVLHTFIHAIRQLPLNTDDYNAGWVYPEDHLREAREISAQLPIIYDFVEPWLAAGNQVFDLGKGQRVSFDQNAAEEVFRTYAELVLTRGGTGHNWPILEASSLVGNALALSDPAERAHYLKYFLEENTDRQDALPKIGAFYDEHGGSWPESFGYSQHVGEFLTYLFTLLSHHEPSSQLVRKYPQVVDALSEAYYFTYPGGKETILHGDGHREYHPLLNGYEMAYHLGRREGLPDLTATFGALINHSVATDGYERFTLPDERAYSAAMYREPTKLLWFEPEVPAPVGEYPLPVTDELPFAGITLQRNLSPSGKAEDGLMGFVGGGSYVHGHATGMSMELFGKGFVLGGKGGRARYRTDIHENYYRIFASNNTVIVNGATTSGGGWVRLGHDRVQRLAAEPEPDVAPVSPNFSFSVSAFHDTMGTKAEAYQERTLGIIRTTDSTGYYVDVFRSRSELEPQFHDYIYRNAGESLSIATGGKQLALQPDPDRYQGNAEGEWRQNRVFRQPGWHFFQDVSSSARTDGTVTATFGAEKLTNERIEMRAFLPGGEDRTYTTAMSPRSTEGPRIYRKNRTPTLVVRQHGEAWDRPFAVAFEPVSGGRNGVDSVKAIRRGRRCEGLLVKSNERAGGVAQLILSPADPTVELVLEEYNLRFQGTYGVVTYGASGSLSSVYVGEGSLLSVGELGLRSADGRPLAAFLDFSGKQPKIKTTKPIYHNEGGGRERLIRPE